MPQPNPSGRKQGEDLMTEDPEYKRKDKTDQGRTEQNSTNENEDVTYREDRKENYDKEGDIQKDGRQVQRSQDENSVDDDEDEVL